ncbi:MAG: YdcF family protein [Alphaproteobacteria bacterium]|nr:YdcF family protein [Alphaproteobacteria bacterium]
MAPAADAIVVLGCPAHRGASGPAALIRRIDCGIRLFDAGAAPLLVFSGGGEGPEPEAEFMHRVALAHGVPGGALVCDTTSRNTFENARETARLLHARGLRSVLLVSDGTHLPRAGLLFRCAGLRVVGRAAAPPPSVSWEIRALIREFAALPASLLRMAEARCSVRRRAVFRTARWGAQAEGSGAKRTPRRGASHSR